KSKWVVETTKKALADAKDDGGRFKAYFRKAHAERLRTEHDLVVEAVTFDPSAAQDENSALTYSDPSGRPLAPKLPPPPIDGPDVTFRGLREAAAGAAPAGLIADRGGRRWVLGNQGRVHHLLAAHCLGKIETLYGSIFEGILGERV